MQRPLLFSLACVLLFCFWRATASCLSTCCSAVLRPPPLWTTTKILCSPSAPFSIQASPYVGAIRPEKKKRNMPCNGSANVTVSLLSETPHARLQPPFFFSHILEEESAHTR